MKKIVIADKLLFYTVIDAFEYVEKHPNEGLTIFVYPPKPSLWKRLKRWFYWVLYKL